jgi:hypothetical protein
MYELRLQYPKGHPMNLIAKLMMNSLYGKFGMKDQLSVVEIIEITSEEDINSLKELIDLWGNSVQDWVLLEKHVIIIRDKKIDLRTDPENSSYSFGGTDINIAIASTITSYARSYMSLFKNNPDFHLFYSDTDSIAIDSPLPKSMVGSILGQLKLEHVIDKAVFLAPKVYGLITENGREIIKVKGLNHDVKNKLHFSDIEPLLVTKSSREFNQEKYFKSILKGITPNTLISENIHYEDIASLLVQDTTRDFTQEKGYKSITLGTMTVSDVAYTLKVTSNKRQAVYVDGIYNSTIPYYYDEIENKENN